MNVIKHAKATRCRVHVERAVERVSISVIDNGRGLPANPRRPGSGLGLRSMRTRAEELGGRCTIGSVATGGTRVDAWLPLYPAARDTATTDQVTVPA